MSWTPTAAIPEIFRAIRPRICTLPGHRTGDVSRFRAIATGIWRSILFACRLPEGKRARETHFSAEVPTRHARVRAPPGVFLPLRREIQLDLHGRFHRLAVQQRRFVLPLHHRINRGATGTLAPRQQPESNPEADR